MEKLLIMCEGPNEKEIIKILLEDCIKKYHKHNGSHDKDEHYLDELLK